MVAKWSIKTEANIDCSRRPTEMAMPMAMTEAEAEYSSHLPASTRTCEQGIFRASQNVEEASD